MTTPNNKPIDKYQSDNHIRLYSHQQLQARIKELELQNKELNHWSKIIYDEKKQLETKLQIAIRALEKIALGESQFDNVDHMYTAREALKEIEG